MASRAWNERRSLSPTPSIDFGGMQFGGESSSQKYSHQGGSSNPEGRRLDSKALPSVRRLGKGLSGFLYETTWKGNTYVRKDFPLGSLHQNVFEKEAIALLNLHHRNIVSCPHYTVGKSSCSLLLEYVDDDLQNIIQKKIEAQRKENRTGSSTTLHSRALDIDETRSLMSSKAKRGEITGAGLGLLKMPENEPTAPFEVPKAVDIISEIATGIKFLHDNGIVHGDLKPKNVLVGNDGIVKLVDYGLVETKKRIKLVSKRTRHFEILMWKAPEVFEKLLGPVTEDSDDPFTDSDTDEDEDEEIESSVIFTKSRLAMADVYSFGLVCSRILGGNLLYSNLSLTQLREQRMGGFKPQLPPTCPDFLRRLIFSSLERDPWRRPTMDIFAIFLIDFQSYQRPRLMEDADFMKIDGSSYSEPSEDHGALEEPKAEELLNLCMETIQKLSAQYSSWSTEDDRTEDYLMNGHQCKFLVGRLTDTRGSLQKIQRSPLLDEKTIPVLEELHQVLLDVETVINASRITSLQWPRAVIEQSDMKETFARLLYGVQWHVSVLLSILVDNSQESFITFEPALCEGQLSVGDEFSLLTTMKEDKESLKDRLRSVKLDDPTEKRLAKEFLAMKRRSEKEDLSNKSYQFLENSEALKDLLVADYSTGFSLIPSSPGLLYLNPEELDFNGTLLGRGASAEVRKTNLMGGKYALKILRTSSTKEFDQEMDALQRLGHHPHIIRLLGYSKERRVCCLIMEEMDEDLQTALSDISRDRERKKLTATRPLLDVQAVSLMLQIGEGVKYIHSKGMAHRDLKSRKVLVNLVDPSSRSYSRFSSVKIADFGLTKTKNTSQTSSNQSLNRGTSKWTAPEVVRSGDQEMYSRFDPRKADVYGFAIICFEILTGKDPYEHDLSVKLLESQVKASTLRPTLPEDCPPKLASLIRRCWHLISHERPLFPEICKELRYIKGLLLRGDRRRLELQDIHPLGPLESPQVQGPWGGEGGVKFFDLGTSINRMKLKYSQSPGLVGLMEVDYNIAGSYVVRRYCDENRWGHLHAVIEFEHSEFITHISGYVSQRNVLISGKKVTIHVIVSLTIYTNIKSYGPFGDEEGEPFASAVGRVIGFHGRCGALLDSLGVVISTS